MSTVGRRPPEGVSISTVSYRLDLAAFRGFLYVINPRSWSLPKQPATSHLRTLRFLTSIGSGFGHVCHIATSALRHVDEMMTKYNFWRYTLGPYAVLNLKGNFPVISSNVMNGRASKIIILMSILYAPIIGPSTIQLGPITWGIWTSIRTIDSQKMLESDASSLIKLLRFAATRRKSCIDGFFNTSDVHAGSFGPSVSTSLTIWSIIYNFGQFHYKRPLWEVKKSRVISKIVKCAFKGKCTSPFCWKIYFSVNCTQHSSKDETYKIT